MPHNDDCYGSTFRVFEPITQGLVVEQGSAKPARVKPNQKTKVMQPIGNMVRGDKSGLNWEKIKKGKAQASNQSSEGEALEVSNDAMDEYTNELASDVHDAFEDGWLTEEEFEAFQDDIDVLMAQGESNIISNY